MKYFKRFSSGWPYPDRRRVGIMVVYREGDWIYLDVDLWWWTFMFNIWRLH